MAFLADLANVTDDATTSMVAALQCYDATSRSGPRHRPRGMGIGRTPPRCHQSERPPGTGTLPDVMIYKEGGCQFGAVQAAVEAAPEHSAGRYVIYIKEGVYEEMVRVPFKKRNLVFIGDRMGKTINDGLPQRRHSRRLHLQYGHRRVVSGELDQAILCPIILPPPPRWGGFPGSCYKSQESSLLVFGAFVGVGLIFAIVFKGIFDGILLGNVVEMRGAGRLVEAQAIEEYKKSLIFEMGLVWIGRVSLEYGYQLAFARLRARHPSLEIEANAFMLLPEDADMPMADEQSFNDSSPKAEE
ncbi:hypothetical protein BHE74_00022234 [Ensete ventricosum]|nr:hypothetical protein BHE74_00022234 [Ensete ventricosum]